MSYGKIAKEFKAGAAEARRNLQKDFRGKYVAAREIELLAVTAAGHRSDANGGEPLDFVPVGKLSGKRIAQAFENLPADASKISLSLGFDLWESFGEYIQTMGRGPSFDYEPRIEHYEVDVEKEAA
jgi:hypothetical protein